MNVDRVWGVRGRWTLVVQRWSHCTCSILVLSSFGWSEFAIWAAGVSVFIWFEELVLHLVSWSMRGMSLWLISCGLFGLNNSPNVCSAHCEHESNFDQIPWVGYGPAQDCCFGRANIIVVVRLIIDVVFRLTCLIISTRFLNEKKKIIICRNHKFRCITFSCFNFSKWKIIFHKLNIMRDYHFSVFHIKYLIPFRPSVGSLGRRLDCPLFQTYLYVSQYICNIPSTPTVFIWL